MEKNGHLAKDFPPLHLDACIMVLLFAYFYALIWFIAIACMCMKCVSAYVHGHTGIMECVCRSVYSFHLHVGTMEHTRAVKLVQTALWSTASPRWSPVSAAV